MNTQQIIEFFVNKSNLKLADGSLTLTGLNDQDGQISNLDFRFGRQAVQMGTNQLKIALATPFKNACLLVLPTGKVTAVPKMSGVSVSYPLGNVTPENQTKYGFTIYTDIYKDCNYLFEMSYLAIGF